MYRIHIQSVTHESNVPKRALLLQWAKKSLAAKVVAGELTLRIVDREEMSVLNSVYRHQSGPTNVLSFPFDLKEDVIQLDIPLLGDIIICAPIVNQEARDQHKANHAHWAHMVIHGIFHLLGYDHETNQEAIIMETLEIETLQALGFTNPYNE